MAIQPDIQTFRLALDNATNHVVLTDTNGIIFYANHGAEVTTGYTKSEIIGNTPSLWGGLMSKNFYRTLWKTIKQDLKPFTGEVLNRKKNGQTYNCLLRVSPIKDENNNLTGFIATEEDITQIKKLTNSLDEQKKFLRKIIDTDPNLIFAKEWSGKFTLANKAVAALYGTTPDGLLGKSDIDFNGDKKQVEHFIKDDQEVMKSMQPKFIHEEQVTDAKTGTVKWFQTIKIPLIFADGPVQILGVSTDITERKKYEEIIEIEKLKDEAILASIGEGLIVTDENGQVTLMNHTAEILTGWDFEHLKGKKVIDTLRLLDETENGIPASERPLTRAIRDAKQSVISGYYVKRNKTRFPIAATITPIIFNKKIIGSIEIFRDITHEKDVDRAKSEFVSLAAHQLRAPLTVISWYTEFLLSPDHKHDDAKIQKKHLLEIYHANKRMIKLVDSLLNVSRVELGTFLIEPVEVDLVKMSHNVIDELRNQIDQKKLTIKQHYSKKNILVKTDLNLVRIILQNLFTNAIKYSYFEGEIDLDISITDKVLITLTDHGIGIEKKDQSKIFTKFFRADNAKSMDPEGNGLGLYIIKSLLEHASGKIRFESGAKGSVFYVTFPRNAAKQKKSKEKIK